MVGIPGKSKGCITCRRRKLGCDLQEPSCLRCTRTGRTCEGYARGLVFINRTTQGLERRAAFENAQPRLNCPADHIQHSQRVSYFRVPQSIDGRELMRQKFESLFLESFLPADTKVGTRYDSSSLWIEELVSLTDRGRALNDSLMALSITRAGRSAHDQRLVRYGKLAYSSALQGLQNMLSGLHSGQNGNALAIAQILALYEAFESTSDSISAHDNHVLGASSLIIPQSLEWDSSTTSIASLKNVICVCMAHSIQYRKASILLQHMAYFSTCNNFEISLHLIGLRIGALLEDIDKGRAALENDQHLLRHLNQCLSLDNELEVLRQGIMEASPTVSSISGQENGFPNLYITHLMLDYWGLRLIIGITAIPICERLKNWHAAHISPSISTVKSRLIAKVEKRYYRAELIDLSSKILHNMPYCMREASGLFSSLRCLFPGRVVLMIYELYPCEELEHCQSLFGDLSEKRGLTFAHNLSKALGPWSTQA